MPLLPLKHVVVDEGRLLTRPWVQWALAVQRLISDVQTNPASGATVTIDWSVSDEYHLTLTADTVLTFLYPASGGRYVLLLEQDAVGGWTVTWPANVRWMNGSPPTLSVAPSAIDRIDLLYVSSTDTYLGSFTLGY